VASQIDSRTILDMAGAEKLLGRGDMLFLSAEFSRPRRIQGAFVGPLEIKKAVDFIAKENIPEVLQEFNEDEENQASAGGGEMTTSQPSSGDMEDAITNFSMPDDLYDEAKEIVLQYKKASASLLQRRLQIGYARAARILDLLEENGVIGPGNGAKPRDILVESEDDKISKEFQDPGNLEFN